MRRYRLVALILLGLVTGFALPAPAPVPEAKRTVVLQENCEHCSGRGTLYVRNGLTGAVEGLVVCHRCGGTGRSVVEILPMPRRD
jgi:hypothetical protein